jgi:hypothetical protein
MTPIRILAIAAAVGGLTALGAAIQVNAGGDKVAFPEGFEKTMVHYGTVDHVKFKQVREFYTSQAAIDAVKAGKPTPSGTVVVMVVNGAKLDDKKEPVKDANGRYIKAQLIGYSVMEKRTGWGTEYAADIRNGEWEYQAFTADKKVNAKAVLANCFKCHKPLDKADYLFTYDRMKTAAK